MENEVIIFKSVYKNYKLYKNDKHRFLGIFFKGVKHKIKKANYNLNFSVKKGESVAVIGRNGAGKSTLLKLITGVIFPTKGEVIIKERVSALLELTAGFDPEFTGRENIFLKGQILGLKEKEIKLLLKDIIKFAELGNYIDQPVRTYSSGMRARLGFSINVNINPEILVIDEALSVGDAVFRKKCDEKIKQMMKKEEITILFVTHNIESARKMCKRGIVLDQGKIAFDGEIDKAIKKYGELYG